MKQNRKKVDNYLRQIKSSEDRIKYKESQLAELKKATSFMTNISYDNNKVKTSFRTDAFEDKIINYIDLEKDIESDRLQYFETKQRIINEILSIGDDRLSQVLYKKYVEKESFFRICDEMRYSEPHARYLLGKALDVFGEIININHSI